MSTKKSTSKARAGKRGTKTTERRTPDLTRVPPFPEDASGKIVSAKSIVSATMDTLDAGNTSEIDPHWTLSIAVGLLEQALTQLDRESIGRKEGAQ